MPSPINLEVTGDDYFHVELGPIPGKPDWHEQSKWASYAFPDWQSAQAFADTHRKLEPHREIRVIPPAEND